MQEIPVPGDIVAYKHGHLDQQLTQGKMFSGYGLCLAQLSDDTSRVLWMTVPDVTEIDL